MVGIVSSAIILVVLLAGFIFVFMHGQKAGSGYGGGRSHRKSLKSRISGGKSSGHHSSVAGSSKKRGKSSRLSKKSAGKSGLSKSGIGSKKK